MKKYFSAGVAILLPVILTVLVVGFLINFLTKPFLALAENGLVHFGFTRFSDSAILFFGVKLAIILLLLVVIVVIGYLARMFLIEYLFHLGDHLFHRLPLVNKVYKACQEVVNAILSPESSSFSQVVLVPFPCERNLSIGLITRESITVHKEGDGNEDLVPVFIPGTPNPSVGFMLMFKQSQLHRVDIKVDEAMKFIVSCGTVMPEDGLVGLNRRSGDEDHLL